ncbi:MAG TPA: trypsin-like peptidase domain-containing protein [Candidatus Acidoferrales bacterium]|nr:trypsin-like peptidase domain-containing protein [Candidatus Acidoferrales bacterium]
MESPLSTPTFPPPQSVAKKTRRFSKNLLIMLLIGLAIGVSIGYAVTYTDFNSKLTNLQSQLGLDGGTGNSGANTQTYLLDDNISLATLYSAVKSSVVVIRDIITVHGMFGQQGNSMQQGSGFVTSVNGQKVIVTNNHVVEGAFNFTVTFSDGNSYPATVLGQDAKADLAVLSVPNIPSSASGLTLVNSNTLSVGDPVIAVGSPYGLSGTLTTGIISALGRTIVETDDNGKETQTIANTIQTSTPINSGNSGGPLLNYAGQVVGITTAGISNSEGLGFAIPSSTIIRELPTLVSSGTYDQHPSIGTKGVDMNYQIAQAMGVSVTYGYLIETVSSNNGLQGGDRYQAILGDNVIVGGDIITAINSQRIANTDDLLSYLEQHTLPGQTVSFTVVRDGQTQNVQVTIGKA